jgi:rubrerythrin
MENKIQLIAPIVTEGNEFKELASVLCLPDEKKRQVDLQYFTAVFVSSGGNLNYAYFLPSELLKARDSISQKAVDLEHMDRDVVGHIYDKAFVTASKMEPIDPREALKDPDVEKMDIHTLIAGVIYSNRFPEVSQEIKMGHWKVSMECFYDSFDLKIGNVIIPKKEAEALGYAEFVGKPVIVKSEGKEVCSDMMYRVLRGILFTGCGFVKNPANPPSVILEYAALKKQAEEENLIVTLDNVESYMKAKQEDESLTIIPSRKEARSMANKSKAASIRWQCNICGGILTAQNPPAECPMCNAMDTEWQVVPDEQDNPGAFDKTKLSIPGKAVSIRWQCNVCSGIVSGELPPMLCPMCEAMDTQWRPVPNEQDNPGAFDKTKLSTPGKAASIRWQCNVCNGIVSGDLPPMLCPMCEAMDTQWRPVPDEQDNPGAFDKNKLSTPSKAASIQWSCTVCGDIISAESPPAECPNCPGVMDQKWEAVDNERDNPDQINTDKFATPSKAASIQWSCTVCGNIVSAELPPAECPGCPGVMDQKWEAVDNERDNPDQMDTTKFGKGNTTKDYDGLDGPGVCVSYKKEVYKPEGEGGEKLPDSEVIHSEWCNLFATGCTTVPKGKATEPACLRWENAEVIKTEYKKRMKGKEVSKLLEIVENIDGIIRNRQDNAGIKESAQWTREYINSLPDGAFALIEPGYPSKTKNKNARHLPHHTCSGGTSNKCLDLPHLRNAFARVNQIKAVVPGNSDSAIRKRAASHLENHRGALKTEK